MSLKSVSVHDCKTVAANSLFCPWCLESFNLASGLWRFDGVEKGWRKGCCWYYQIYNALWCSAWVSVSYLLQECGVWNYLQHFWIQWSSSQETNPVPFTKFIRSLKRSWKYVSNLKTSFEFQFQHVKDFFIFLNTYLSVFLAFWTSYMNPSLSWYFPQHIYGAIIYSFLQFSVITKPYSLVF